MTPSHLKYTFNDPKFLNVFLFVFVQGSMSEDAPPPSRSMAVGQPAFLPRNAHPTALARSLPVSVPVWGCKSNRAAQGDGNSGERVSYELLERRKLLAIAAPCEEESSVCPIEEIFE